ERRYAWHLVLRNLQNDKTLFGANYVRNLAGFHAKSRVFQFLSQGSALKQSKIATLGSARTIGILFRYLVELCSFADLCEQLVGSGLRLRHPFLFRDFRDTIALRGV